MFSYEIAKFLRTPSFTEHLRWLLLYVEMFRWQILLKFVCMLRKRKHCKYFINITPIEHSFKTIRSSHQRCSIIKGVLRNFPKFTGKQLCQSLFFNKVAVLRPATLLKKTLWHKCFPVIFAKFIRTPFLQNTSGRLFLNH